MADRAVTKFDDLRLGMKPFAEKLAKYIAATTTADECRVVGLAGEWGSGKTSVLHAVRDLLTQQRIDVRYVSLATVPHEQTLLGRLVKQVLDARTDELCRPYSEWLLRLATGEGPALVVKASAAALVLGCLITVVDKCISGANSDTGATIGVGIMALVATVVVGTNAVAQKDTFGIAAYVLSRIPRRPCGKPHVLILDDIERLEPKEVRTVMRFIMLLQQTKSGLTVVLGYDRKQLAKSLGEAREGGDFDARLAKYVNVEAAMPVVLETDLLRHLFAPAVRKEAEAVGVEVTSGSRADGILLQPPTPRDATRAAHLASTVAGWIGAESTARVTMPVTMEALFVAGLLLSQVPDTMRAVTDLFWPDDHARDVQSAAIMGYPRARTEVERLHTASGGKSGERDAALRDLLDRMLEGGLEAYAKKTSKMLGFSLNWRRDVFEVVYAAYLMRALDNPATLAPPALVDRVLSAVFPTEEAVDGSVALEVVVQELERLGQYRSRQVDLLRRIDLKVFVTGTFDTATVVALGVVMDGVCSRWPYLTANCASVLVQGLTKKLASPEPFETDMRAVLGILTRPALVHLLLKWLREQAQQAQQRKPVLHEALLRLQELAAEQMRNVLGPAKEAANLDITAPGDAAVETVFALLDVPQAHRMDYLRARWAARPNEVGEFTKYFSNLDDTDDDKLRPLRYIEASVGLQEFVTAAKLECGVREAMELDQLASALAEDDKRRERPSVTVS